MKPILLVVALALGVLAWPALVLPAAPTGPLAHCLIDNADGKPATETTPAIPPTCHLSLQPDVVKPMVSLNLKTGKTALGLDVAAVGVCEGVTYQPAQWYASGFDLCLNLTGSQSMPTVLFPSGSFHFASYGSLGAGPYCLADSTGTGFSCQWLLLLSGNFAVGL